VSGRVPLEPGSIAAGDGTASVSALSGNDPSRLQLPWPPKQLMPNFKRRKHWSAYQPFTKSYRRDCWALAKEARLALCAGDVPVPIEITFHPPDRRKRDDDGMIGAFKAGRDGLADALGIDDHLFRPTYRIAEPVKGGCVVVSIP
jgi:crossover junction endodeoxyribonuclease RusA